MTVAVTTTFDRTTSLEAMGEQHRWTAQLDPAWSSLRGIHGGYLTAVTVRAFEAAFPDRPVRTIHVSFLSAGAVGPADVALVTVRRGRSATVARVRIEQDGRTVLEATITGLAAPSAVAGWSTSITDGPRPAVECIPLRTPPGIGHFDHARAIIDPADVPFTGGHRARIAGYVTPAEPRVVDAAWLAMLLDWFPPSPFSRHTTPIGGLSIDYTVHIHHVPVDVPADGWLTAVFEAREAAGGLALEQGRVAGPSGRLVAESFHTRLLSTAGPADMVTSIG
jgi:acyl-CoA thioesterase